MRETVVLRGEIRALQQLVKNPPAPTFAIGGGKLPDVLVKAISAHTATSDHKTASLLQLIASSRLSRRAAGRARHLQLTS